MGLYGSSGPNTLQRVDISMGLMKTSLQAQKQGLIGMEIAPPVSVPLKSAKFPIVNESVLNQKRVSDQRTPGANFNRIDLQFTTGSYDTAQYGLECALDRDEMTYYDSDIEQDMIRGEALEINALKNYENRAITTALTAPSAATTIGDPWSDPASTPLTDMTNIKIELRNKRRVVDNSLLKLVLDWEVAELLKLNAEILDKLSTTVRKFTGDVTAELLAQAFGVGKVVIANSWENTSASGTAEADVVYTTQWNKNKAWLGICQATKGNGFRFANTLMWRDGANGFTQYYEVSKKEDVLRYEKQYGFHVVDSASALVIDGVYTA